MSEATRRRRLRRRILLWSLAPALLAAAFGTLLIAQHFIARTAVAQYSQEQYEEALNTSGQLALVNLVERWKPHYNMGTSYLELAALPEAGEQFAIALQLAAPAEQCPIRANYAITLEREGDDLVIAGNTEGAMTKYREAVALIEAQDPACDRSTSNRSLDDSLERITEKLQQPQQQEPQPEEDSESTPSPEAEPSPDALDELEDGLDENQQDRADELDEDRDFGGGSGGGVDEPW